MGAFLLAIIVAVGIGYGATVVLEGFQTTADKAYVGSGARPDPEPTLSGAKPKS